MPFYAGWDIGNYQDNYNASIHHPDGFEKKISIDYDKIVTYDFTISWDEGETTPPSSHWMVSFDAGITSEGSSGGPLFSKQKRIIGQLHGGSENEEFYGKLNYSWNNNNSGFPTLKTFLDPQNTGATFVNGYYPAANPPDAFFTSSYNNVCLSYPVTFFDHSAFSPSSYVWTISPSGFRYINNTNRNSANPQVEFTTAGTYTVKLRVSNNNGSDSLQVSSYIAAGSNINVKLLSNAGNEVCYSNFDSLVFTGLGAANYSWSLEPQGSPFEFTRIDGDTAILKKKVNSIPDSTFSLFVNISGAMGTCTDTARQIIRFLKQFNDNISNAVEIGLGVSKTFSNACATIESNEPIPPFDSCTGLKSWCDEYGTGKDIVENSVWFKFQGPATGKAGLKSSGFDNQIAIYDANSYQDILAGQYTLLAANDDETDTNPYPVIPEVTVTPGKTYWIQVDGSGGGSEGNFTLTLSDRNITSTLELEEEDTFDVLYPQPVSDVLHINSKIFTGKKIEIKILSLSGKICMHTTQKNTGDKISLQVESLSPGIYLIYISQENKSVVKKFVKL
jgi:PKD repeat protein